MTIKNIGTHTTHCCELHGCKYSYSLSEDDECPVEAKTHEQLYPCDMCEPVSRLKAQMVELQEELEFAEKLEENRKKRAANLVQ